MPRRRQHYPVENIRSEIDYAEWLYGRRMSEQTVLERLISSLRAKGAPIDGHERPVVILWTDPKQEWAPLIELLLQHVEEFLVLGDYQPQRRTGPAIWVRCIIDGSVDEPDLPVDRPPIVYLPGVARQRLRAGPDCPDGLKPMVELLYRGALWHHPNGNDWTVNAYLSSRSTLDFDIAGDRATSDALLRALSEVALSPVRQLANRHLAADDFDRMLAGDVVRDLLRWMGDPDGARNRSGSNEWEAFCSRCRDELEFDPAREADIVAGERMARGEGAWAKVWERFAEAPRSYGDIAGLLRRSKPSGGFRFDRDRWPDLNEEDEETVRRKLKALPTLRHDQARQTVIELENDHGGRRNWVWGRVGSAPMAQILNPLSKLAKATRWALGGTTPDDLAQAYLDGGWKADLGAWETLAIAPFEDEEWIKETVRHLLEPWLEDSARAFQTAVARAPLPGCGGQPTVEAAPDGCILFADGLRFDLAHGLAERLEGDGLRVELERRWGALPTVTGTAKPAVTPVAEQVEGDVLGPTFGARLKTSGKPADAPGLRNAMKACGYQLLGGSGSYAPRSHPARGWLEMGMFDRLGHQTGAGVARQLDNELERVAERIKRLLDAGWSTVRVVTDHGWLLLPGGLPKVDLPKHLTESRWARCAVIAGESTPEVTRAPWHWNGAQWFATAPGIACFNKSEEYAHGGLSIQECLIPQLIVTRVGATRVTARIKSVTWRGLRCFIESEIGGGPVTADLRLDRPNGESVAATSKPVDDEGTVSLVLADDEHETAALVLVLVDEAGGILAHQSTRVGVNR